MRRQRTVEKSNQLPHDLAERRILHWRALRLTHFVFDSVPTPSPWRPPSIPGEVKVCPALPERESSQVVMEIRNPLCDYNLRLADTATEVIPILKELSIAGLNARDLSHWKANHDIASEVRLDPFAPPKEGKHLYVRARDFAGEYSIGYPEDELSVTRQRLAAASALFERTAKATRRILQTVGPAGILSRLKVDLVARSVEFDGRPYNRLTKNQTILMHYLRLGAGEWVSSDDIAVTEHKTQFKVSLYRPALAKRHPALGRIIDNLRGTGERIVLPLPPE